MWNHGVPGCSVQIGMLTAAAAFELGVAAAVEQEELVWCDDEVDDVGDRQAGGR